MRKCANTGGDVSVGDFSMGGGYNSGHEDLEIQLQINCFDGKPFNSLE